MKKLLNWLPCFLHDWELGSNCPVYRNIGDKIPLYYQKIYKCKNCSKTKKVKC